MIKSNIRDARADISQKIAPKYPISKSGFHTDCLRLGISDKANAAVCMNRRDMVNDECSDMEVSCWHG